MGGEAYSDPTGDQLSDASHKEKMLIKGKRWNSSDQLSDVSRKVKSILDDLHNSMGARKHTLHVHVTLKRPIDWRLSKCQVTPHSWKTCRIVSVNVPLFFFIAGG